MSQALDGVRILDLSRGPAAGLAGMILADFGARVLCVTQPGTEDQFTRLGAAPMWRRGKATLPLDLDDEEQRARLEQLCAGADVLLCSWRSASLRRRGLDFESLHSRHPHLTLCHVSGFGSRGPLADVAGYEHAVAAYSGRMRNFAGTVDRGGPVFSALQVGVHACAQAAATGILAALLERAGSGSGRLVETSLLQGMLPYEQGPMLGAQFPDKFPNLLPALQADSEEPPMPSLFYHPAQAGDGRWMQFGNLLPHLFDNFLIVTGLIDIVADPDFDAKQLRLPAAKQEAFRQRMLARIQERPAADWMTELIADGGVVGTTYQSTQQALQDPDIVANGHVVTDAAGVKQLGPLARLSKTPARIPPALLPGSSAEISADALRVWLESPRAAPSRPARQTPPLQGIRVVELATIIAAPMGAALLADLGADVTKVEQVGGDPFRSMGAGIGSARVNPGKRSLSVDMKTEAGKAAVLAVIKDADVVIHNFRPGVPERLGISYADVAALNPGVIYLQSNGYGPDGPGAQRPSTHPIPGAAMGGVVYQMGERLPADLQDFDQLCLWTRRLMRANEVNPDPNTAMVIATSVMLGLVARQRNGSGQQIFVDMFGANAYANHDDFLSYADKPPRPLPDAQGLGLNPLYRLYPCARGNRASGTGPGGKRDGGNGGKNTGGAWVFLAIPQAHEQQTFINAVTAAGHQAPGADILAAADARAEQALAELFAAAGAAYWQDLLTARGIACVRADGPLPSDFWLTDPQSGAMALTTEARHPQWGSYRRHGPMQIFDGAANTITLKGPPLAGQHNRELLAEAGYSNAEIDRLQADGVLWQAGP